MPWPPSLPHPPLHPNRVQVGVLPPAWRRVFWAMLGLLLGLVALPQPCLACTCAQPLPADAVAQASAIFRGRVIAREVDPPRQPLGWLPAPSTIASTIGVRFLVVTRWKGAETTDVVVATPAGGDAGCGTPLALGEEYLVYATATGEYPLYTSLCHRTQPFAAAREDLALLGPGRLAPEAPPAPTATGLGWAVVAIGGAALAALMVGRWRNRR